MAEQLQQLKKQLQSRELRQTATQTVQTVTLSLKSLRRSVLHPYVQVVCLWTQMLQATWQWT